MGDEAGEGAGPRRAMQATMEAFEGTGTRQKTGLDLTPDLCNTDLSKAQASWWYSLLKT